MDRLTSTRILGSEPRIKKTANPRRKDMMKPL